MRELVNLGWALELRMQSGGDWTFDVRDRFVIASNPRGDCLHIFSVKGRRKQEYEPNKKSVALWRKWSHFEPDSAICCPLSSARLVKIGKAAAVCYRSDKWTGKEADYIHHFSNPPNVYADNTVRPTVIEIRGRLRVKTEGITG